MADKHYLTQDGVVGRIRNDGAAVPEVWGERSKRWKPYPELDTMHDAREVTPAEAEQAAPGCTRAVRAGA